MTLTLPENPLGLDYEDAVAAKLLSLGYYTETNLALVGEENKTILEFDVIATPTNKDDYQNRKIVEAKSGENLNKGAHELFFSLCAKTLYTRQKGAWLIHKTVLPDSTKNSITALSLEMSELAKVSVLTTHFDIQSGVATKDSDSIHEVIKMSKELRDVIFKVGYFSRKADRAAAKEFSTWSKNHKEQAIGAKTYYAEFERSLFRESPSERVRAMYDAYKKM